MGLEAVSEPIATHRIEGIIASVRWRDDEEGRSIFTVDTDDGDRITVVGKVLYPIEGEQIIVDGHFERHPEWGNQLQAHSYEKPTPATKEGVIRYLSSNLFTGIGEKTAEKIVETLGEDCIQKIIDNPNVLSQVPRMKNKAERIAKQLIEHRAMEGALTFLFKFGIKQHVAMKLYEIYGGMLKDIVERCPYRLILDVKGIAFKTADSIARATNSGLDSIERIEAAILDIVRVASESDGHVYLPVKEAAEKLVELVPDISLSKKMFLKALTELIDRNRIVLSKHHGADILYIPSNYKAERDLAKHINRLMNERRSTVEYNGSLRGLADQIAYELQVPYDDVQKGAIVNFLKNHVSLVIGGPGVGKTSVIRGIICAVEKVMQRTGKKPIILSCAPTGRAASRISETSGYDAATLHFALELDPGTQKATYNEKNPLEVDVVIIDEASMVGIRDAAKLFEAIPTGAKVIIVGDPQQLPSVQTGAVLRDLIASHCIPVTELKKIYRTAEDSPIPHMSQRIQQGKLPYNIEPNFVMRYVESEEEVMEKIYLAVKYELSKGRRLEDILILSPMYEGPGGVTPINLMVQERFNPNRSGSPEWVLNKKRNITIRKNSRVMQLKNNRNIGVMNGEIGIVRKIVLPDSDGGTEREQTGYMMIQFGNKIVEYHPDTIQKLTLSYAASVHKMQGSECPVIIQVLLTRHFKLLFRSLFYTGITRASEKVYLFAEPKALQIAVNTVREMKRYSRLADLIRNPLLK